MAAETRLPEPIWTVSASFFGPFLPPPFFGGVAALLVVSTSLSS